MDIAVTECSPAEATKHVQEALVTPISDAVFQRLLDDVNNTTTNTARLRSAASYDSGEWLHAPPIRRTTHVGRSHSSSSGLPTGSGNLPASHIPMLLDCGRRQDPAWSDLLEEYVASNTPRPNERIVWRAVKTAQYPTVKELAGLARTDGKRPDRATLIP